MDQLYKCGYCGFLLSSQCEDLLEHECLKDRYVEGVHDLVEDHKKVLTLVCKTPTLAPQPIQTAAFEETLIRLVQERPPLYNLSLPLSERSNSKKLQLWTQISNILGGKIAVEDLQKKWKYLRDSYVRSKKKVSQYKPSGSGAQPPSDPGFRHFEAMKFVDDGASQQMTISSILPVAMRDEDVRFGPNSGPSSSTSTPMMSPESVTPSIKRKKIDAKQELEKGIASILAQPPEKPIDGIDGFLIRLGESLRKLPYRERFRLEIDIMQLVYKTEMKNNVE